MARRTASADRLVQVGDLDQRLGAVDVHDLEPGDVTDPAGVAVGDQTQPFGPAGPQVLDGPLRDDPAGVEYDEPVAEPLDEVELVAREEDGNAAGGVRTQQVHHRVDRGRVEAREGFVEDEGLRLVEQRGDDLDALLVAEAELLDPVAAAVARGRTARGSPRPTRRACAAGSPDSSPRYTSWSRTFCLG